MSQWKAHFKKGVVSFREGNYEDAANRFSEALGLGGDGSTIYDARAAVYQKMGKLKEALRDSKSVIDLQPARWQGYARSARLFFEIRRYEAAARMVDLALERVPSDQAARREDMTTLRMDIISARDKATQEAARLSSLRAYHFGKLPVEIANTMFSMILAEDHAYVVTLAQVCKNWRTAILGSSSFWDTLVLNNKSLKCKIRVWKERSRNRLRELALLTDFSNNPSILDELGTLSMKCLQVLRLEQFPITGLRTHLPLSIANPVEVSLKGLSGTVASLRGDLQLLDEAPVFHCRALDLRSSSDWSQLSDNLEHLKSCSLMSCLNPFDWPHLLWLLHRNPSLERLEVFSFEPRSSDSISGRDIPPLITLPHLSILSLAATVPDRLLPLLVLPSLRSLELTSIRQPLTSSLQHLADGAASSLTSLCIERAGLDTQLLIRVLEAATALESLQLVSIADNAANAVLEALARSLPSPSSKPAAAARVYCPALRHLNCSKNHDVKGGPLVRLVKLRLAEAEATAAVASEGDALASTQLVQPLQSLTINECPLVDPDVLPWLRGKVPSLSAVFMSKKAAGWKR